MWAKGRADKAAGRQRELRDGLRQASNLGERGPSTRVTAVTGLFGGANIVDSAKADKDFV